MADVVGMYFLTVHRFTMQNLTSEFDMILQLTSQRSVTLVLMPISYIIMFVTILLIIDASSAVLHPPSSP